MDQQIQSRSQSWKATDRVIRAFGALITVAIEGRARRATLAFRLPKPPTSSCLTVMIYWNLRQWRNGYGSWSLIQNLPSSKGTLSVLVLRSMCGGKVSIAAVLS